MQNLRQLKLDVSDMPAEGPDAWLSEQADDIRRVTFVENGDLYQRPLIEPGAYVDPTAQLIGGIIVKKGCYIGPNAVVRLDEKSSLNPFVMGEFSNLQDCAVVHAASEHIGHRVIVAHQAIVHGAVVEDNVTIYIQSVVDGGGTVIGEGSFLHQGVYVGRGIRIPKNRYMAPGLKVLTQEEADRLPSVPETAREISDHVLELNAGHVSRYLAE